MPLKLGNASLEYLAGFFDGEGSICIMRNGPGIDTVRVQVSNTNEEIVREFQRRWGGTVTVRKVPTGTRPQWGWSVTYRRARAFLTEVGPLLHLKAPQAALAWRFWEIPRPLGVGYSEEQTAERSEMKVIMSSLNKGRV